MRELFCTDPLAGFSLRAEAAFSLGELACDNRSIFYRACPKFVTRFASKINPEVCRQMARKKIATILICYARLSQDSSDALNRSRTGKTRFLIYSSRLLSERIRTVVDKGYFPHDSSHSEDEASARKMAGFQNFF